jgi:hypothetical protein
MNSFFFYFISATGSNVIKSSLDFVQGLNIVCGPSNTGKSYIYHCIDYLFGSSVVPFDESTGYDTIRMEVITGNGHSLSLERQLGKNTVQVISDVPGIDSEKYSTSSGKQKLSALWLALIGISEEHKIVKNQHFHSQTLTWRTLLHSFLIDEERIPQKEPILLQTQYAARPASLSALLYLMTGKDYGEFAAQDTPEIKKARKKAKSDYITEKLGELTEQHGKIADSMASLEGVDIEAEMRSVIDRITQTENDIIIATKRSRKLLEQVYDISARLEEGDFLYDRYKALESQYLSDIKRLEFISDGEENFVNSSTPTRCPVCDSELTEQEDIHLHDSNVALSTITAKLNDLREVIVELSQDKVILGKRLDELKTENDNLLSVIRNKLEPQAAELNTKLKDYRIVVQMKHEMSVIKILSEGMNADLGVIEFDDESELKFKPKEYFTRDFIDTMSSYLAEMLESCKFEKFLTARFSIDSFDVVTNGRRKDIEGSGFRAFLNTVLAFSFMRYLTKHGKYAPGLLVIDSPILSLMEKESEKATDSMKSSLFQYLIDNQQFGQVIILENEIPSIDYSRTNVERFTMDENNGRYGFLHSVRN